MSVSRLSAPFSRAIAWRSIAAVAGYVAALGIAELLLAQDGFLVGGISHLLLLLTLLAAYATVGSVPYRPMLLALTLPSLMRLASLTVTVVDLPPIAWIAMTGAPTLLGTLLAIRVLRVDLQSLFGAPSDLPLQVVVALSGVVHGLVLYLILRPAALVPVADPVAVVIAVLVLVLFVAILEELIFRGVIQAVAVRVTGSPMAAVAIASTVYACMFLSAGSPLTPLAMLTTGWFFGAIVTLTRSLWGVTGAHAIMISGLLIVWPALLQ